MKTLLEGEVVVAVSERADGDFHIESPGVDDRRRGFVDRPWTWVRQVHGDRWVESGVPGGRAGDEADAVIATGRAVVACVQVADCVPIALVSSADVAVVHAGWRGLVGGVIDRTVEELRRRGATAVEAVVGPHIRAHCYEFGAEDLAEVASSLGPRAVSWTAGGRPALDLTAGVLDRLADLDVSVIAEDRRCTCRPELFSHRCRGDRERMTMVVYRP